MSKERFDLPTYMIGIDNEGMVILTIFVGELPSGSLKMNRDAILTLIQLLSAAIGANIIMSKITKVSND